MHILQGGNRLVWADLTPSSQVLQFERRFDHFFGNKIELHQNLAHTPLLRQSDFQSVEHIGIADDTSLFKKLTQSQDFIQRGRSHFNTLTRHRGTRSHCAQALNRFLATDTAVANTNLHFQTDFQNWLVDSTSEHKHSPQRQSARFYSVQRSLQLLCRNALSGNQKFTEFVGLFIDLLDFAFQHLHAFFEGHAALANNAHDLEHVFFDNDVVLQ